MDRERVLLGIPGRRENMWGHRNIKQEASKEHQAIQ